MPRNTSTHAAGVVITSRPVSDYVPLAKNDDLVVTQYIMTTLEELGLLKMDFLGLRNLTVLDDAAKLVRRSHPDFDPKKIPDDDPAVFQMLRRVRGPEAPEHRGHHRHHRPVPAGAHGLHPPVHCL